METNVTSSEQAGGAPGAETAVRAEPGDSHAPFDGAWRGPAAVALLAVVLLAFAYRALATYDPGAAVPSQIEGAERYLFAPTGSSPPLIFAVTVLLLYMRRRHLWGCLGPEDRALPGVLLVATSCVLTGWSHYVGSPDLQIPAFSLLLLGAGWALCGREGLRLVSIPAVFVLLAITPPAVVVNQIVFPLQLATARISAAALSALGFVSIADGDLIYSSRGLFQVIETCSGWRSMLTLLMAAFVYGEIFYLGRVRYLALVGVAAPLAFAVNQARVVSIALNPTSHFAEVHAIQGIVALVVGVLLLAAIDALLARSIGDPGPRSFAYRRPGPSPARFPMARALTLTALLAASAAATVAVPVWLVDEPRATPLSAFPPRIGSLQASGLPLARSYLGSVNPDEWMHRSYAQPQADEETRRAHEVRVLLAGDRRLSRNRSLLSDKTMRPGAGSTVLARETIRVPGVESPIERLWVRTRGEHAIVYHWRYGVRSLPAEIARAWAGLDRSAWRRAGRATAVRIDTPFDPEGGAASERAALQRLDAMAVEVADFMDAG